MSVQKQMANQQSQTQTEEQSLNYKQRRAAAFQAFAERYPVLKNRLPLKIGIFDDLVAENPETSRSFLRLFLAWHTKTSDYLRNLKSGMPRHNLAGDPVQEVADEHKDRANDEILQKREKFKIHHRNKALTARQEREAALKKLRDTEGYSHQKPMQKNLSGILSYKTEKPVKVKPRSGQTIAAQKPQVTVIVKKKRALAGT